MTGHIEFDSSFRPIGKPAGRKPGDPMRILLMGDFSGFANRGESRERPPLAQRPVSAVDTDNFEALIAHLNPSINISLPGSDQTQLTLSFRQLDDFHPDKLYQDLDSFRVLRRLRKRLLDTASFPRAAAELRKLIAIEPPPPLEQTALRPEESPTPDENDAEILERLLGKRPIGVAEPAAAVAPTAVTRFIKEIVTPYIVPSADPHQPMYVESVDEAIVGLMRELLHHPTFQTLESAWRGVHWLITHLETGQELQVFLMDVTKGELLDDIRASDGVPEKSGLHQRLVDKEVATPGEQDWSVLIGHYTFSIGEEDITLLGTLGAIASEAGGPFLAGADAGILGCRSLAEKTDPGEWQINDADGRQRWAALRRSPYAAWIGLALPRILLRLPYGSKTEEIDAFEFEEMPFSDASDHDAYLWGNPAFACALLIGTSFTAQGWGMEPGDDRDISNLPAHIYAENGESHLQACAEVYLSERAADEILERGLIPVMSMHNQNAIRVLRFQSVAEPAAGLAGAWC